MAPPVVGVAYTFYTVLPSVAAPGTFQANPTLATGDVKVSIDGGALANLATLPVVAPAGSIHVKVVLSPAEMIGENIVLHFADVAGNEWTESVIPIQPWPAPPLTLADVFDTAIDGSVTLRQSMRLQNSALGGKASGLATTTAVYRDLADTKPRITATVDSDGNRTSVTRDLT